MREKIKVPFFWLMTKPGTFLLLYYYSRYANNLPHNTRIFVYFVRQLEYLIKKLSAPTQWARVILIVIKSCNELLCVILLCISIYLKSVFWYKVLILYTVFQTHYLHGLGSVDWWLIFKAKMGPLAKKFGKHATNALTKQRYFFLVLMWWFLISAHPATVSYF